MNYRLFFYSSLFSLSLIVSCGHSDNNKEDVSKEQFQASLQKQFDDFNQSVESADKSLEESIELEKSKEEVQKSLQGTWAYQDDKVFIDYSSRIIKVLMDGKIVYNGSFEISDDKIYYDDRRNGFSSSLDIDYEQKCIGDKRHAIIFKKVSDQDVLRTQQTSDYRRSNNSSSNYSSSSTFRTDQDVYMYLSSHRFTSYDLTLYFGNGGTVMYNKGNPLSNAMRVVRFNSRTAVLSYTSPYSPGTKYITIDNQAGTLTDASGEVYYSR